MPLSQIRGYPRDLLSIAVGSALYIVLNWIPILGPFLSGMVAGSLSKGYWKKGATIGLFSAVLGFLFLALFIFPLWGIYQNVLVLWILLLWNLIAIVFSTLGGLFGSMGSLASSFQKFQPPGRALVICPSCGESNPEGTTRCRICGNEI